MAQHDESTVPESGIELKDHVEAYEAACHATNRAFLVTCVSSLALLGLARTPRLVVDKLSAAFGMELAAPGDRLPIPSYAVVLGLVAVPALVQWGHRKLIHALRLGRTVHALADGRPDQAAVAERLSPPLLGSVAIRNASWVAWVAAWLTVIVALATPVVTDLMMLWDYSHKFSFGGKLERFNGPYRLWFTAAGGDVVRPQAFDNVTSQYHPALLPWWQPWVYLVLLLWAVVLLVDGCVRLLGRDNGLVPCALQSGQGGREDGRTVTAQTAN